MESDKGNSNLYKKYTHPNEKKKAERKTKPVMPEYRQLSRDNIAPPSQAHQLLTGKQKKNPAGTAEIPRNIEPIRAHASTENKSPKIRVNVQLGGMQYRLTAPGKTEELYLMGLAKRADRAISQLRESTPNLSTMDLGMLTLVNVFDDLSRLETKYEKLEDQFSQYLTNNEVEKSNYKKLREQNYALTREIDRLRAIIDNYEKLINGEPIGPAPRSALPLEELLACSEYADKQDHEDS